LPVNIHPLLLVVSFLILGIFASSLDLPSGYFISSSCILLAVTIFFTFKSKKSLGLFLCLALISGYLRHRYQLYEYEKFHTAYGRVNCCVDGQITNIASLEHPFMKQCTTVELTNIELPDNILHQAHATIQFYSPALLSFQVGDTIRLNNLLIKQPSSPAFKNYLIKESIVATIFCQKPDYTLIDRPKFSMQRNIFLQRQRIFNALQSKMPTQVFSFFSSLFLGNKIINKKYVDQISNQFKFWGIAHFMARSGLHLVIFILIWTNILKLIPLPFLFKQALLLLLSFIYFILSWPTISFIRAFYTFLCYKFCVFLHARSHTLHILTVVTLIVLMANPMQLFFLDFQLSFSLTFALAWFNTIYQIKKSEQPLILVK
jgi:ComEC/Rec2-related protein